MKYKNIAHLFFCLTMTGYSFPTYASGTKFKCVTGDYPYQESAFVSVFSDTVIIKKNNIECTLTLDVTDTSEISLYRSNTSDDGCEQIFSSGSRGEANWLATVEGNLVNGGLRTPVHITLGFVLHDDLGANRSYQRYFECEI